MASKRSPGRFRMGCLRRTGPGWVVSDEPVPDGLPPTDRPKDRRPYKEGRALVRTKSGYPKPASSTNRVNKHKKEVRFCLIHFVAGKASVDRSAVQLFFSQLDDSLISSLKSSSNDKSASLDSVPHVDVDVQINTHYSFLKRDKTVKT